MQVAGAQLAAALAAPPQIMAPHALLVEAETGSILFEKAADELMVPASMAKLMTIAVVLVALMVAVQKSLMDRLR